VASLRLVSSGAATDGVTFFTAKSDYLFWSSSSKLLTFLVPSSPSLRLSSWRFIQYPGKFGRKKFTLIRVSRPRRRHAGRSVPPPPRSDATDANKFCCSQWRIQTFRLGGHDAPRSRAAGARIEAPKAPRRWGVGRGCPLCPLSRKNFNLVDSDV